MKKLKVIACDIDGVLLEDTFSPVLYSLAEKFGYPYTRELERNMFSRPREESLQYVLKNVMTSSANNKLGKENNLIKYYFSERKKYMSKNPSGPIDGALEFLQRMAQLDIELICYGGLEEKDIVADFSPCMQYFSEYICTNDFRPGLKEITKDKKKIDYNQILFIDDVNTVAEAAKSLNIPFIGIPANHSWGYQREDMENTGVKYLVSSVREIDKNMIYKIDQDIAEGKIWK